MLQSKHGLIESVTV